MGLVRKTVAGIQNLCHYFFLYYELCASSCAADCRATHLGSVGSDKLNRTEFEWFTMESHGSGHTDSTARIRSAAEKQREEGEKQHDECKPLHRQGSKDESRREVGHSQASTSRLERWVVSSVLHRNSSVNSILSGVSGTV